MSMSLTPSAHERSREQSRPQETSLQRSATTLGIDLGRLGPEMDKAGPRVQNFARSLMKALDRHAATFKQFSRTDNELVPLQDQAKRGVLNDRGRSQVQTLETRRRSLVRESGEAALSVAMTSRRLARAMGREPDPPSPTMKQQIGGALRDRMMDAMRSPQVGKMGRVLALASALGVKPEDMRPAKGNPMSERDQARFEGMRAATALAVSVKHGPTAAAALGFRDPREAVLLHHKMAERTPGGLGVALGKSDRATIKNVAESLTNDYRQHKDLSVKLGGLAANDPHRQALQRQVDVCSRRVMAGVNTLTMWAHAGRRDEVLGVIAQSQGGRNLANAIDKRAGQMLDRARVDELARGIPSQGPMGMAFGGKNHGVSSVLKFAHVAHTLGQGRESALTKLGQDGRLSKRDSRILEKDVERMGRMTDHAARMGRIFFNRFGAERGAAMAAFGRQYPEHAKALGIAVEQEAPSSEPRSARMARLASRPWEQQTSKVGGLMKDPGGRDALNRHLDTKAGIVAGLDQHRAMGMVLGTENVRKSLALGNATAAALRDRERATAEMLKEVLGAKTPAVERSLAADRSPGYGPAPRPRWA